MGSQPTGSRPPSDRLTNPSPLFWFRTSDVFTKPREFGGQKRPLPLYLVEPEVIFRRIWATPADDRFLNLAD